MAPTQHPKTWNEIMQRCPCWVIGCLMCWTAGCGYTTERPFPEHVRSVHVEMFQTRDFRRDLEFRMTEAVAKRIEMDTPYRIAPRQQADSVLSGEIVEVRENVLGDDFRTDLPREKSVTIILSFRWQDQRTGRILSERQRFPYTATYIPPAGETFFQGSLRSIDGAAQQLVEAMESPW